MLSCEGCQQKKLVAFSGRRRGFCPSCMGRRMAQTALWHAAQSDLWDGGFAAEEDWKNGWWAVVEPDIIYNANPVLVASRCRSNARSPGAPSVCSRSRASPVSLLSVPWRSCLMRARIQQPVSSKRRPAAAAHAEVRGRAGAFLRCLARSHGSHLTPSGVPLNMKTAPSSTTDFS